MGGYFLRGQSALSWRHDHIAAPDDGGHAFGPGFRPEMLIEQAGKITLPILVIHGDADGIAQAEGSKAFFQGVSSQDKTIKLYPGFYHETMNEPLADRRQVLSDIVGWINAHT